MVPSTSAAAPTTNLISLSRHSGDGAVRGWLWVIAMMILAMVVVGGATRLTESGLSITEWKPIHGVIPPLSEAEWLEEFDKYRQIPEYQQINKGMSLAEFQFIYWWEWGHRLLGRLIGFVFLIPFIWFAVRGYLRREMVPPLAGLFVLGGLQGAVGWWMVASGLSERTDVSQYRLATHLTLACIILALSVWFAEGLRSVRSRLAENPAVVNIAKLIVVAVLVQIFLGGLVAGLNAGLIYNTWPLMDGAFVPDGLLQMSPAWINFFENHLTVQFVHRIGAYLLLALVVAHYVQVRMEALDAAVERRALILVLFVLAQAAVGIATLLLVVPLWLALAHQAMAAVLLMLAATHARRTSDGGKPAPATPVRA